MRMVLIVLRSSLEDDVLGLLEREGVTAFTVLPQALGVGEAGPAMHSFPWPGFNLVILAALDDVQATRLVQGITVFRDRAVERQLGATVPLRAFVLPCVQAV